jgi:ABC-2 type transport system ATP-binding protein
MNVIETCGLGKRYRSSWALEDCTLAIPAGRVVAMVGPNGAGKTTLLHCVVGLTTPTTGTVTVLGDVPAGSLAALEQVAFVAQDAPLHEYLSVAAMLDLAGALNRVFDRAQAEQRLLALGIRLQLKVGRLSGGQQAQLALSLALARNPSLLVLDEPLARLDPLARHDFMGFVMSAVAEKGLSVVFSSHVVSELERVADYLVVLAQGQLQIAGPIDDLLASHAMWSGPTDDVERVTDHYPVLQAQNAGRHSRLLVRSDVSAEPPKGWEGDGLSLEELVLAYLREPGARALARPYALSAQGVNEVNV